MEQQLHEPLLTTGDAARLASELLGRGIAAETVRYWERTGRLRAIYTQGGQRLYTKAAVLDALRARAARLEGRGTR